MGLFGKSKQPDPKEQVNEWCKKIRKEGYTLDRQIRGIQREEQKVVRQIKLSAKKGDTESCKVLAKEVVNARKAVRKIHTAKANLSSVEMQMKQQAAQVRLAGSLQKSTEVMKAMQQLVKLPEIQKTMQELSKEMMRAGIIEEMLEDTMGVMDEEEDLEEDVQTEVDKILSELTADVGKKLVEAPLAPQDSILEPEAPEEEEPEEDLTEMQERLQALRS